MTVPMELILPFALLVLFPGHIFAECPLVGFDEVSVVFHGTASDISKAPRITFEVDRVWKGRVSRRVEVFHPYQGTRVEISEGFGKFEGNQSYLVFASYVNAQGRPTTRLTERNSLLMVNICGTRAATLAEAVRYAGGQTGNTPR
jgi:hypothetical protein